MSFGIRTSALVGLLATVVKVSAHGYVQGVDIGGTYHTGYLVTEYPYMEDPPASIGWTEDATNLGYISPDAYSTGDIVCHKDATNGQLSATVAAGDTIVVNWHSWPNGHRGPVLDYLASCDGDCSTIDKTSLKFFKIDEAGLIDDSVVPGTWASDQLIANNASWSVTIPSTIKAGPYVLRHEIISLHAAVTADGAQHYPQCLNLLVTGGGSDVPAGTPAEKLYSETDPGILVNIYTSGLTYTIPGPTVYSGGSSGATATVATEKASSTSAALPTTTQVTGSVPTTLVTSITSSAPEATSVATGDDDDTCEAEEL